MKHEKIISGEIIRIEGTNELNAVMYACSAVRDAPHRLYGDDVKARALEIGKIAGRIEGTPGLPLEQVKLDLSTEDFKLLSRASQYLLTARNARKIRRSASEELISAAELFAAEEGLRLSECRRTTGSIPSRSKLFHVLSKSKRIF